GRARSTRLPDHPAMAQMQLVELAVAVLELDPELAVRPRKAAADLGDPELEAVRQVDAHAVLRPLRVDDRLAARLDQARDGDARAPRGDVAGEVDRREERREDAAQRAVIYIEVRRAGLGILALEDPAQRVALGRVGAGVDHDLPGPVALVDRAR